MSTVKGMKAQPPKTAQPEKLRKILFYLPLKFAHESVEKLIALECDELTVLEIRLRLFEIGIINEHYLDRKITFERLQVKVTQKIKRVRSFIARLDNLEPVKECVEIIEAQLQLIEQNATGKMRIRITAKAA